METKNLSTLKIHKLSQEQYLRELEAGNIDEYALYLTPSDDDISNKQDKLVGVQGQIVGFDENGNAVAQNMPIDTTLSVEGQAADAKAVGDAISAIPQSDWDINDESNPAFIKNRPFYSGEMSEVEIISYENRTGTDIGEGTIRFEIMGVSLANGTPGSFKVGQEYVVTIDGIRYVTVAKQGENFNYIGNEETMNTGVFSEETPFFAYGADADMSMSGEPYVVFLMPTSDGSLLHAWGIKTFEENVKTIDPKYLPEHLQFGETGNTTITTVLPYEEREFYYNAEEMGEVALYIDESFVPFEEGKVYHVTIDGVEYTCQSFCDVDNFGPMVILGSVELLMEGTAPDELPFCSYSATSDDESIFTFGFKSTSGGMHSFGIEVEETEIVKIDQKYLPDTGKDVILFDIGDEIGSEDGYEYYNITCNYTYEELDALLTNVANASDLSAYPPVKLRRRWNDFQSVVIPMDYYDRNRGNYRFFFSFIADSFISNYFVNYGRDGTANAILRGTDLDDDFVAFPKQSPEGTPIVDYGISGQVLASTGNKKVEWKNVSELIDEELDSKQNKTLIVTAKIGSSSDFWDGTSSGNLTDISHTWQQIEDAIANNAEVKMKVGFTDSDEMFIFTMSEDLRSEGCIIFHAIGENLVIYTVITQDGSGQWYKEGFATVSHILEKQDKLTGNAGQIVGFDENGNAVAQEAPEAVTSWNDLEDKPFYQEETWAFISDTFSGQTLTVIHDEDKYSNCFNELGRYRFTINGTDVYEYEKTSSDVQFVIGDNSMQTIPFAIRKVYSENTQTRFQIVGTITITSCKAEYYTSSAKYLDDIYLSNNIARTKDLVGIKSPFNGEVFNDLENNSARAIYSHAEGKFTTAVSQASHAEGWATIAQGDCSHAEGSGTSTDGLGSHAEGCGTRASGQAQHVEGQYNIESVDFIHIVGNGTDAALRSNAHTLKLSGEAWFAGDVYVGSTSGTNKDEGSVKLAKEITMTGSTSTTAGSTGLVPSPSSGDQDKFLRGDGTWAEAGTTFIFGTIGTNWTEDENTGVKTQLVQLTGVTSTMNGSLDIVMTHERTTEGYAAFVEEQNQFLTYITNGDAETVDGGVMFYIYGEPNTIEIPFALEVG